MGISRRNGPTFRSGALLVGVETVCMVDDEHEELKLLLKTEYMRTEGDEEFKFVEAVIEAENTDAIIFVLSDGSTWSLFENGDCSMVTRLASN